MDGVRRLAALVAVMGCVGIGASAVRADEAQEIVHLLRAATQQVVSHPFENVVLHLELDAKENGGVLAEIGLAQLGLNDQEGAVRTAKALPAVDDCLNCGDAYDEFLAELAASLAQAGKADAALDVFKSHFGRRRTAHSLGELMVIARAQLNAKDFEGARQTCRNAFAAIFAGAGAEYGTACALSVVADMQFRIGDKDQLLKSRQLIDAAVKALPVKGQDRALILARLAVLYSKLGDDAAAQQALEQAPLALAAKTVGAENARCYIAAAQAKLGHVAKAVRIIEAIDDKEADRETALVEVALLQWERGELEGATRTIELTRPPTDWSDLVLLEIAKAYSQRGDSEAAIRTAKRVEDDLRRAQAHLEIATILAQRGKKLEARSLAVSLDFPMEDFHPFKDTKKERFRFEDSRSWGLEFKHTVSGTNHMRRHAREMNRDLFASALRCHLAIHGPARIAFQKEAPGSDIRKVAEARASMGDVRGALAWSAELSEGRRISALIGIAEGLAESRRLAEKPAAPRLNRRHELIVRLHPAFLNDDSH